MIVFCEYLCENFVFCLNDILFVYFYFEISALAAQLPSKVTVNSAKVSKGTKALLAACT